jgi:hypothetical protein
MNDRLAAERERADMLLSQYESMPTVRVDPYGRCDDDDEDASAIRSEPPPPDSQRREAAERHVAALVEVLARASDDDARELAIARIDGALSLLMHTGCVAFEELDAWRSRVAAVVPPPTPPPSDPEWEAALGPRTVPAPGALRAVVPAPLARHDGLCLLSVSLHEHTTEIDWQLVYRGRMRIIDAYRIAVSIRLVDDVQTDYGGLEGGAGWGGTASGGPYAVRGRSRTDTPVPAHARELTVTRGDAVWRVALPLEDGQAT